jgi:hypothetical protein
MAKARQHWRRNGSSVAAWRRDGFMPRAPASAAPQPSWHGGQGSPCPPLTRSRAQYAFAET